ncbi:hypothetical protein FRX31_012338 [Thalictrum thalictroides]|uniref:Uncharacterized protein n=1 Tax=Thalictrum thalictroides TaxID=46969 RepID=A0A7J6VIN9_THATH|nr:hypothetical protein FRX31_025446 [Thalictrum thalictroides]KAF5198077.1 hypothetical protein FRX31_012338 [Thalictrum thalictroides]
MTIVSVADESMEAESGAGEIESEFSVHGPGINICKILFIEPSKAYVTFLSPVRKPHGKENNPH